MNTPYRYRMNPSEWHNNQIIKFFCHFFASIQYLTSVNLIVFTKLFDYQCVFFLPSKIHIIISTFISALSHFIVSSNSYSSSGKLYQLAPTARMYPRSWYFLRSLWTFFSFTKSLYCGQESFKCKVPMWKHSQGVDKFGAFESILLKLR